MNGLAVSKCRSRRADASKLAPYSVVPASRISVALFAASSTGPYVAGSRLASPSSRLRRFSSVCRSARMSSMCTVSMSSAGSTCPVTCTTSGSEKARTTWQMASDAICQVVRAFSDPDVVHVTGHVDPADDIETVHIELILADLQTLEKRRKRLEGDAKRDRATYGPVLEAANKATEILDAGTTLYGASFDASALRDLHLLTAKPFIYVFNSDEETLADPEQQQQLTASVGPAPAVVLCAKIEAELAD